MAILVAQNAGFCFGVARAVDAVYALCDRPDHGRIYTVGSLIHNRHLVAELEARGVAVITPEDFPSVVASANEADPCTIVIRAHGVSREISEELARYAEQNCYVSVCDMTCPYVKKIHRLVSEYRSRQLIVFGDPKHPEVEGIVSYSDSQAIVLTSPEEAETLLPSDKPTIIVAQTTQNTAKWKKCQKNLEKVCTNAIIFDTICSVTEKRQSEAASLAAEVDLMLVIGGRNSSNSNKLYETAKRVQPQTYFIEQASELDYIRFTPFSKVGITAGASTPGGIIQEVKTRMSELENKITDAGEVSGGEDFAGMLEDSLRPLNTGDTVTGVITSVSSGELHVDLGAKVTGIIPYDEVTDDASVRLADLFSVGDEVSTVVIKVSDRDGVATLSKKRVDNKLRWKKVLDAYNEGTVIEGTVADVIKGGVLLNYEGNRLFVPASQTGVAKDGDLSVLVGTVQKAKIIEVREDRKRAVASIRKVKSEERKLREADFWANIEEGKVYEGEVKSITSYGAFVDLGGVDGMVHRTELSWTHIKSPADVVSVGQVIRVFVKEFNAETKRISLGYKTEETNPWNVFTGKYAVGDMAEVRVVSLMPFGAFAEVVPGVDGLIHVNQITNHKIAQPSDVLSVGQVVNVEITAIDEENHKISLSIRALMEKGYPGVEVPSTEEDTVEETVSDEE
ncbi:MAG: bifunctional 4-hydroxy-3-methylbut-2-enyl diphosphate reductase/30S ribosomal protein S1 [Ruminococcaceae bacterium]|nr:bifunctional 4-hydroxy-3-methylbut-2-enyl diphosphate reductase/30S ribosomal protein S1 [Oscillospiraceae bacterium]